MSDKIYVIEEITMDDNYIVGYHTDLKTAEEYLKVVEDMDDLFEDSHYHIVEIENLEDIGYLNGKFEEYEIDENWDEYDESWDEYAGMYSTDFEPFKKAHRKQQQLDEWN